MKKRLENSLWLMFTSILLMTLTSPSLAIPPIDDWFQMDIGNPAHTGQFNNTNGTMSLTGSGSDIGQTDDEFFYVYFPITGDIEITVQVLDVEKSNRWAKGGIMLREQLSPNSPNVAYLYSAHQWATFQYRSTPSDETQLRKQNISHEQIYLKLIREGNQFTALYSIDNLTWTQQHTKEVEIATNYYVGLAVSPYKSGLTSTALFDSLEIQTDHSDITCASQGAQCGTIDDGQGGLLQCGTCSANSSCDSHNQCQDLAEEDILSNCQLKGAQCGFTRDEQGNTLNCGACQTGQSCLSNRCENSCSHSQFGKGTFDDLFAYTPLRFTYEDQSVNQHTVDAQLLPMDRSNHINPYESRIDFTDRKVSIDFKERSLSGPMTVSFKMMPSHSDHAAVIMNNHALKIEQAAGGLSFTLNTSQGPVSHLNQSTILKTRSCNHVTLHITDDSIKSSINGMSVSTDTNVNLLNTLNGELAIGPYSGKVWDVRIYERSLTDSDVKSIGGECDVAQDDPLPNAEYPNYLCAAYYCVYWPDGVTDTTYDSFQYQVNAHDMTWEHNTLSTGMYPHGELCSWLEAPDYTLLNEGYRKSWVKNFNFDKPWNRHVLHENFHAYQGPIGNSTKWLAESTATWGAYNQNPTSLDSKLGMYTFMPHLALWTIQNSEYNDDELVQHSKGGHQYGAGIFHYYLTNHVLDHFAVGLMYNRKHPDINLAPITGKPSEAIFNMLANAGLDMRDVFSEFAARVTTWDMNNRETFLLSEDASYKRMKGNNDNREDPYPESEIDNKIAEFYDVNGTEGNWLPVPARYKIAAWAYNAYEVDVTETVTYDIGIKPSVTNPDSAEFRAQVVVYNEALQTRAYHIIPTTTAGIPSSVQVSANIGDKVYLVVASTPSTIFKDFDLFLYDYKIERLSL